MNAKDFWNRYPEWQRRMVLNHLREEGIKIGKELLALSSKKRTGVETRRMNRLQAKSVIFGRAQAVLEEATEHEPQAVAAP